MDIDSDIYSEWFRPKNIPAEIPLPERTVMALANTPWPNQQEVVDGVTPVAEVSQDPALFANDDTLYVRELPSDPKSES